MKGTENTVLRTCLDSIEDLNDDDAHFINFLAERHFSYRLTQAHRKRLYRIGKKVGIDGEKIYANEAVKKAEERVKL